MVFHFIILILALLYPESKKGVCLLFLSLSVMVGNKTLDLILGNKAILF